MKTSRKPARKRPENDAEKLKRLGPTRRIVQWVKNPKPNATTLIAVLECGHGRATPNGPRTTIRCNQCRIEKRDGRKKLSRFAKNLMVVGKQATAVKPAWAAKKKAAKKSATKAKPARRAKAAPARKAKPAAKPARKLGHGVKPARTPSTPIEEARPIVREAVPEMPVREAVPEELVERVAVNE